MSTLEQRLYNGSRAKEVLENEDFQAAFEAIEKDILEQWTNSPARDAEGREKLWSYLHLLRKVRTQLQSSLETGRLAELDLQHKRTMSERARSMLGMSS